MRFFVKSKNKYLKQKIILEATYLGHEYYEGKRADIVFCDIDTALPAPNDVTLSKDRDADITLPFELGALEPYFKGGASLNILYCEGEGEKVSFKGEYIRLTGFEKKLFYSLYSAMGEFVSREELLKTVWDNSADIGIVNVYVYYLRKKLEKDGEKVIIAGRKEGYRIDKKFLGGDGLC